MAEELVLDTAIRDWVLIPLSVVMVLIGVLRYFVSKLMRSPAASSPSPDPKLVREGQVVIRARNLRTNAQFIPAKAFKARKVYYTNEENGLLHVPKEDAQKAQAAMFSDPNMAMDMMKKNLSMIVPQTLTFAWVNFFFSGFVAAKIPFPLTQRFRGMLQNGIDLSTVDVSYVSSRSWYFLNLFGLRGLFSLILGEENATDDAQKMMQMGGGFGVNPTMASPRRQGVEALRGAKASPTPCHKRGRSRGGATSRPLRRKAEQEGCQEPPDSDSLRLLHHRRLCSFAFPILAGSGAHPGRCAIDLKGSTSSSNRSAGESRRRQSICRKPRSIWSGAAGRRSCGAAREDRDDASREMYRLCGVGFGRGWAG